MESKKLALVMVLGLFFQSWCFGQLNTWLGGNGLWSDQTNWSQGTVPDDTDSVVIGGTPIVTVPGGINAVAQSILVEFQAELRIAGVATLTIGGGTGILLTCLGQFVNDGVINIDGTGSIGSGILFTNIATNNGSIILTNARGITCNDLNNPGVIEIGQFDGFEFEAMRINGTLNNSGEIHIQGTLGNSSDGIWNRDSIINSGQIYIRNLVGSQSNGIDNDGYLINMEKIEITEITGFAHGILNRDTVNNAGKIIIQNIEDATRAAIHNIAADAHVINSDSVCIKNAASYVAEGISYVSGSWLNQSNGIIVIEGINGSVAEGISGSGHFDNLGEIIILNQSERFGLAVGGVFNNLGTIDFLNFTGGTGIQNTGHFTNTATGVIQLNNFAGFAINQNSDTLTNEGQIICNNFNSTKMIEVTGGVLWNKGSISFHSTLSDFGNCIFVNTNGEAINDQAGVLNFENISGGNAINLRSKLTNLGIIQINNLTSEEASTSLSSGGVMTNAGHLNITNVNGHGIQLLTADSLINLAGGLITIDSVSGTFKKSITATSTEFVNHGSIYLTNNSSDEGLNFSGTPTFHNHGLLHIEKVTGDAVFFTSDLLNHPCGRIDTDNNLRVISAGVLTNMGAIVQDFSATNIFTNTASNTGVIVDQQSSFNGANYTNNGLLFESFSGPISCLDTVVNVSTGTNMSAITTQMDIFSDTTLATSVGEINLSSNELYLMPPSNGLSEVYAVFEFADCNQILPLFFDQPITSCGNTITWTGMVSNDWFTAGNWSGNEIPTCNDEVVIPPSSTVLISMAMQAEALLLDVAEQVDLQVVGELIVKGQL